jgi:hypothetical protein
VETIRVGERFEPEEARRIRSAAARVFAGCPKLYLAAVVFVAWAVGAKFCRASLHKNPRPLAQLISTSTSGAPKV